MADCRISLKARYSRIILDMNKTINEVIFYTVFPTLPFLLPLKVYTKRCCRKRPTFAFGGKGHRIRVGPKWNTRTNHIYKKKEIAWTLKMEGLRLLSGGSSLVTEPGTATSLATAMERVKARSGIQPMIRGNSVNVGMYHFQKKKKEKGKERKKGYRKFYCVLLIALQSETPSNTSRYPANQSRNG